MSEKYDTSESSGTPTEDVVHDHHDKDMAEVEEQKVVTEQQPQQAPSGPGPGEPPDGGALAWTQVAGAFFTIFNSWGIVNAFGVYQNYYQETFMSDESPSTISWIGTMQAFSITVVPLVSGRLLDGGYLKYVVTFGSFMVVFGLMMCSLAHEFYQVLLSQGFCVGIGCACLFSSGITTVAPYFKKRRATAMGIAASGSSVGGVIYPIMAQKLIPKVGFPWATRIIAFVILGICIPTCIVLKSRLPPRKSGSLIDMASFKDAPFMLFTFGGVFAFMGLYVPIFYIEPYSHTHDIKPNVATYILSILNAGSVLGRTLPNVVADKTGNLNIMIPCVFIAGALTFGWIGIKDTGGLVAFAVIYGFMSGVLVSMPGPIISNMTQDMTKIGTRMGMCFAICSIGILCGAPVAGAIINRMDGAYWGSQIFGGTAVMIGVGFMTVSRMVFTNGKLVAKA